MGVSAQAAMEFMSGNDVPKSLTNEVLRWTRFHHAQTSGDAKKKEFLGSFSLRACVRACVREAGCAFKTGINLPEIKSHLHSHLISRAAFTSAKVHAPSQVLTPQPQTASRL